MFIFLQEVYRRATAVPHQRACDLKLLRRIWLCAVKHSATGAPCMLSENRTIFSNFYFTFSKTNKDIFKGAKIFEGKNIAVIYIFLQKLSKRVLNKSSLWPQISSFNPRSWFSWSNISFFLSWYADDRLACNFAVLESQIVYNVSK